MRHADKTLCTNFIRDVNLILNIDELQRWACDVTNFELFH